VSRSTTNTRPAPCAPGSVTFVGAGPGDPELITVRGMRALQHADVVLYDALVDPCVVRDLDAELIFVGKRCGKHALPQPQINQLLGDLALEGRAVVRLKGGDPGVLGRVGEEALHLAERGVPYEIVPGVSSAVAAPAFAGIPVTHRGVADSFALATAHRRKDELEFSIPPYSPRTTILLLMPIATTPAWQEQLLATGYPRDLPVAFISQATKRDQQVLVSTVGGAVEAVQTASVRSPAMVVIGRVVELRRSLRWFADSEVDCSVASQEVASAESWVA
jgi:uroporphyrin-III C-methyltransferase